MRTSAPGNSAPVPPQHGRASTGPRPRRGFTLIELMIVVALIAVASAVATLALRDPASTQLEREAARLSALLEAARAEARSSGLAVMWVPSTDPAADAAFRFVGLPAKLGLPERWLVAGITAEIRNDQGLARGVVLGPEPLIGAQRIVLRLDNQQIRLATDGFGPFAPVTEASDVATAR